MLLAVLMSRCSSDGPQVPRPRNPRKVCSYCNLGSKVVRIRAARDVQQDARDSVVKACWSGEVGKAAAQLSLECLLMYNFRVGDHTSKNVKPTNRSICLRARLFCVPGDILSLRAFGRAW